VGDEGQRTLGRGLRVFLPKRSGRRVAGIGELLEPGGPLPRVEAVEFGERNEDFAPNFDDVGEIPAQRPRHGRNGANVRGDVLSRHSVAARRSDGELAPDVAKVDGETVDFNLGGAFRGPGGPLVPLFEVVEGEDVLQRVEPFEVRDALEARGWGGADGLGGRGIDRQLGMLRLEAPQFADEAVVVLVGDDRLVARMVGRLGRSHEGGYLVPTLAGVAEVLSHLTIVAHPDGPRPLIPAKG